MKDWKSWLLPHLLPIVAFLAITILYLYPVFFENKELPQNDIRQWEGSYQEVKTYYDTSGERALWTNSMFGGMPTYQIAPYAPNSLIGTRIVYDLLVSGKSLPKPANSVFLYMLGMYLLLLAFGLRPWLAFIGAVAYAFSSYNIIFIEAGHMLKTYALGTAPMVMAGIVYTLRSRKYLFGGALTAVALAVHLRTNHPQISYYMAIVIGLYLIFELVNFYRRQELAAYFKSAGVFAVGAILAVLSTFTYLYTTAEFTPDTIRGPSELTQREGEASSGLDRTYATQWSYGIGETMTLLIPDARGGASPMPDRKGGVKGNIGDVSPKAVEQADPQVRPIVEQLDPYWGAQPFTSGPFYFGAVVMFLFVLSLLILRGPIVWWALVVTALSIVLSWGHNLPSVTNFFFDYFPLYNKFRSVNMTLVMASLVVPLIAALGLRKVITNPEILDNKNRKRLYWAAGITGGLALILYVVPGLVGDFMSPVNAEGGSADMRTLQQYQQMLIEQQGLPQPQVASIIDNVREGMVAARKYIFKQDAIRTFFFVLLAGALIFFYIRRTMKEHFLILGLAAIVLLDMWTVDKRYLNNEDFVRQSEQAWIPTAADSRIMQDPDPHYRVMNVTVSTFNDATTSYFHKSIGGYHGAKFRRFQEMREHYLDQIVGIFQQNAQQPREQQAPPQAVFEYLQQQGMLKTLNMLNTKYIIASQQANGVVVNPDRLGNAWFVEDFLPVPTADSAIAALRTFDPVTTAIVEIEKFGEYIQDLNPVKAPGASITLTQYAPDRLVYRATTPQETFAVFSEVYYNKKKGWHAYIDGNEVEHIQTNWLLRGLKVPAGTHKIEFRFEPRSFEIGEMVSLAASILLLLFALGAIGYEIWKSRQRREVVA